jgi:hypothetical protein
MNSVLAVEKGLPPGLWLPTPEESTDQYLRSEFNNRSHRLEDVLDYGSFVVALALLSAEETGRVAMMPVTTDLEELFDTGYGVSPDYLRRKHGGISQLQLGLGFYPRGFIPPVEDLMERMKWIKEYAMQHEYTEQEIESMNFHDLLTWGSSRRLSPDPQLVYKMLDSDTTVIRKHIGMEKRNPKRQYTPNDLFRFGATVIEENGGPLSFQELDEKYADEFVGSPYGTIRTVFGTLTNFWLEFGYFTTMRAIDKEDLLNLGVRWAIQHEGTILHTGQIRRLSPQNLFPSQQAVINRFGRISVYREEVEQAYQEYLVLEKELVSRGVDTKVSRLTGRIFIKGTEFSEWVLSHSEALALLSVDSKDTQYILKLLSNGFNLADKTVGDMQLEDMLIVLKRVGIKSKDDRNFVLALIPRFDSSDIV